MAASLLSSRCAAPGALTRRAPRAVRCAAVPARASASAVPRRALLAAGAALAASLAPRRAAAEEAAAVEYVPVEKLATPLRRFERNEYAKLLNDTLKAEAKNLDSRALMRLLFNDAATGAHNGSVHFSEELSRPENAGLAATVKQLEAIRATVDAASKTEDSVSWTDLIACAAQASTRLRFRDAVRAQLREGTLIPPGLVNSFDPPTIQGVDATEPAPAGAIPALSAGVAPWKALFKSLKLSDLEVGAIGPDVVGPDADAAEAMLRQDEGYAKALDAMAASRKQLGRGSYEINYVKAFEKLWQRGFKVDTFKYCYPQERPQLKL